MALHAYTPLLHAVKTSQPHVFALKQLQIYNIPRTSTKSLTNFNYPPPLRGHSSQRSAPSARPLGAAKRPPRCGSVV